MSGSVWLCLLLPLSAGALEAFQACGEQGWMCDDDKSIEELIFDCTISGNPSPDTFFMWNRKLQLPLSTRILTVQNCNRLTVDLSCPDTPEVHALDTVLLQNIENLEFSSSQHTTHHPRVFNISNIGSVAFEYGKFARATEDDKFCSPKFAKILALTNVVVSKIAKQKGFVYKDADVIVMDRVKTLSSIAGHGVEISGNAEVFITNSTFQMDSNSINIVANKINIQDSFFEKDPKLTATTSIDFLGNKVVIFGKGGVTLKTPSLTMLNNTLLSVPRGAFSNLKSRARSAYLDLLKFTFKYNTIHSVEPNALNFAWDNFEPGNVVYKQNLVNCSCENVDWFRSILNTTKSLQSLVNSQIMTENYCMNNKKCKLMDALWDQNKGCGDDPPECFVLVEERKEPVTLENILDTLEHDIESSQQARNKIYIAVTAIKDKLDNYFGKGW